MGGINLNMIPQKYIQKGNKEEKMFLKVSSIDFNSTSFVSNDSTKHLFHSCQF
jgi:hypothetical protein